VYTILEIADRGLLSFAICLLREAELFATSLEINEYKNGHLEPLDLTHLWHFLIVSHSARTTAFATTRFSYFFAHCPELV
jgi:hypothetical protein